jgi:hypothetical protein
MKQNLWKFEDALEFVKSKRYCVDPNFGFRKQLKKYEIVLGLSTEEDYEDYLKKKKDLLCFDFS